MSSACFASSLDLRWSSSFICCSPAFTSGRVLPCSLCHCSRRVIASVWFICVGSSLGLRRTLGCSASLLAWFALFQGCVVSFSLLHQWRLFTASRMSLIRCPCLFALLVSVFAPAVPHSHLDCAGRYAAVNIRTMFRVAGFGLVFTVSQGGGPLSAKEMR